MTDPIRLDVLLAKRGLASSRSQAADLIRRGAVCAGGEKVMKPGRRVDSGISLIVEADAQPYVSRGGLKLEAALDHFAIDANGITALDLGASTGGFTDVLLKRGASHVIALDVGQGQLHRSLREDPRVTSYEKLNARDLSRRHLLRPVDLIVCDVSFISLKLALPPALSLAVSGAQLVALIKPQFEAGREHVGKGGIIQDAAVHNRVCESITGWLSIQPGWSVQSVIPSPVKGPDGNQEFLVAATKELR